MILDAPGQAPPAGRLLGWLCALLCAGCATPPEVGVRSGFRGAAVERVVLAPMYRLGGFGADPAAQARQHTLYQEAFAGWLERRGVEVVRPGALRHHLTERGAWQIYQDGIILRDALTAYFEPSAGALGAEVVTLRRLHDQGALPAGQLLWTELVYHSEGTCRVRADEAVRWAQVIVTSEAERIEPPRPCVVGHVRAKLVDAATGHAMWYGRGLVEVQAAEIGPRARARAVHAVVEATLGGRRGIEALLP